MDNSNPFQSNERMREIMDCREKIEQISVEMKNLEAINQKAAFEYSKEVYEWEMVRQECEKAWKLHNQQLNERKAAILTNVSDHMKKVCSHNNNIQKTVLEVEFDKAITSVGGIDKEDDPKSALMRDRIQMCLEKLQPASIVKRDIHNVLEASKTTIKSLKSHLPPKKGKYEKSGQFTKEERANKIKNARPYLKTGNHINDYMKPRFKKQRDEQIEERAKTLKVSTEMFRKAVMGNEKN